MFIVFLNNYVHQKSENCAVHQFECLFILKIFLLGSNLLTRTCHFLIGSQ